MTRHLTAEDIEAAKAIGRVRKPITEAQKNVLRETFGPLVAQRCPRRRTAA